MPSVSFKFWMRIISRETTTTKEFDTLAVQVRDNSGAVLKTFTTFSNLHETSEYVERQFDLSEFKGKTVHVHLDAKEDGGLPTSFLIDDMSLTVAQ